MPAPLILAGLSLLPKLPEMWGTVAGLFGKKVPDTIEAAGSLAGEVINAFKRGEVSPEVQTKLNDSMYKHEERIKELSLEKMKVEYDLMKGAQEIEKASYQSKDEFVRRTRPKILRDMFKLCTGYILYAPLCIVAFKGFGVADATLLVMIEFLKYLGYSLFGTFTLAYTGYTAGRTTEKVKGKEEGSVSNSLMGTLGALIK
jgi:hypothetical protein